MDNEIYKDFLPKVSSYVRSHVKNIQDAEDLISEIIVKISSKFATFDSNKASVSTWIYTITRNTVCDYYRSSSSRRSRVDDIDKVHIAQAKNTFVEDRLEVLHQCLKKLPQKEHDVIILRFYYGYEPAEIASIMKISYSNVCVIQHRALDKMKQYGLD